MKSARDQVLKRRGPIHALDLVRFLAALLVVGYHLGFKAWALSDSTLAKMLQIPVASPPGYQLGWCGWIGVQVFFVVSGAVISYSAQGVAPIDFARRRLARLLPGVLIAVVLALPVAVALLRVPLGSAVILSLKTVGFMPFGPWIVGQFWTIPIEIAFYALICALIGIGAARNGIGGLAWALGLAGTAYWSAATVGWITPGGRVAELLLLQHGVFFALGILCARLGERGLGLRHLMLAAVCMVGAMMQIRTAAGWEMAQRPDLAAYWPYAFALWFGFVAIIAVGFQWREQIAERVARASGMLRVMGLSTYPLYLTHIHLGGAILSVTASMGVVIAFLCALAGSLFAALVIALWFEPPLHALIDVGLRRVLRRFSGQARSA